MDTRYNSLHVAYAPLPESIIALDNISHVLPHLLGGEDRGKARGRHRRVTQVISIAASYKVTGIICFQPAHTFYIHLPKF